MNSLNHIFFFFPKNYEVSSWLRNTICTKIRGLYGEGRVVGIFFFFAEGVYLLSIPLYFFN